jgi:tRNA-dihydrouridine synthase
MNQNNIGKFIPKNPFFLAPMLEPNDIAFRLICKEAGAGLTYTGMINPLSQKKLDLQDNPALQLFTSDGKGIEEFIKKFHKKVVLFDFNLGCPAKTAKEQCYGVFMQHKLELIEDILKRMNDVCSSYDKPLTIKLRKSKNTIKIIKIANKYCDAIGIHPRTQEQGYGGEPDLKYALNIKKFTSLPLIYSGNVNIENTKELLKDFNFLQIGRNAIGNPNIFAELTNNKKRFSFYDYLELSKKFKLPFSILKYQALSFTKGIEGAKEARGKLIKSKTIKDIKEIYKSLIKE